MAETLEPPDPTRGARELPRVQPPSPPGPVAPPLLMTALAYLALGLVVAFTTVLLHTRWWALAIGLVATAAILVATTPRWWARLAFSVGWVVFVAYAASSRSEGDFLLSTTALDQVLAYGATPVVLVVGIATTVLASRTPHPGGPANLR